MWPSRVTTSRGVVRLLRESPEPSTTRGVRPKPAIVRRTTTAPALVVPPVPNSEPSALISVSAEKLSDGRLVSSVSSARVGELSSARLIEVTVARPVRGAAPVVTPRLRSARANSRAVKPRRTGLEVGPAFCPCGRG